MKRHWRWAMVVGALAAPIEAQEREVSSVPVGTRVRVMVPAVTRAWITGRIVSAEPTLFALEPISSKWGRPLVLDPAMVERLQVSQGWIGTYHREGLILGLLVGTAAGYYAARATDEDAAESKGLLLVAIGGSGGGGAGTLLGALLPKEGWHRVTLPIRTVYDLAPWRRDPRGAGEGTLAYQAVAHMR